MKSEVPEVQADVKCPNLKENREVDFKIKVFRGADKGGVEVTACSEFMHGKGAVTCGQDCIHTQEAHDLHQQEVEKHQKELGKIGHNVIG
jgi:hypothetical protein